MDHALVQHLTLAALLATSSVGCLGTSREPRIPPPPAVSTTAYVSPTGQDTGSGGRDAPFKSIEKALSGDFDRIVLLPGAYASERVDVHRRVLLEGEGTVVIRGHVFVDANEVRLRNVSIGGGLAASFVKRLEVDSATIAAGMKDDAVSLTRSSGTLRRVKLTCGPETCLQATTATVTISDSLGKATDGSKRILRFEQSKGRVEACRLEGGSITQLQLGSGARVEVADTRLIGGSNGLVAVQGATLIARDVSVEEASKTALLVQESKATIEGGRYGSTPHMTVGISGSDVTFHGTHLAPSSYAVASISAHAKRPAKVRFEEGRIEHGTKSALLVTASEVTVAGTYFRGEIEKRRKRRGRRRRQKDEEPPDAITASGIDARVHIESATFETPPGFAVGFYDDASGTVSATITGPNLGGVTAQNVATDPVVIRGTVVKGCAGGSGVLLHEATQVTVDHTRVEGCKAGGVVAGRGSKVTLTNALLEDNGLYGAAAFGGATLSLKGTRISGSKSATFASCGDGARIVDLGNNHLKGPASACP